MEQHGNNHQKNVIVIIPARLKSTRLEEKLLRSLAGKPLILHTIEQAGKARNISRIVVATDSLEILKVVEDAGQKAVLTSPDHVSGSDRIAEAALAFPDYDIVVNVQGDEPLIAPETIEKAVDAVLGDDMLDIATTSEPIETIDDVLSPNVVKVVTNTDGLAIYFSRSPIPFPREHASLYGSVENALRENPSLLKLFRKHTGLYVYRRDFLLRYTKMKPSALEQIEMLEQLRALENGARIKVVEVTERSIGVDTPEDLERAERILSRGAKAEG